MALYRVYLSDAANLVQQIVRIDCGSDGEAVDHARTLIKAGGEVEVWDGDTTAGPLIGSLASTQGAMSSALVKRSAEPCQRSRVA